MQVRRPDDARILQLVQKFPVFRCGRMRWTSFACRQRETQLIISRLFRFRAPIGGSEYEFKNGISFAIKEFIIMLKAIST